MRVRRAVVGAIVMVSFLGLNVMPTRALWDSQGYWKPTRWDDRLIDVVMADHESTIGVVYLAPRPDQTDTMLRLISSWGGRATHVDRLIGYIRAIIPTKNVYEALDVPRGAVASVDVDLSYHSGPSLTGSWVEPPKDEQRIEAATRTPATRSVLRAKPPLYHDLDADAWLRQHPTFDGRGVTIADVEMLVDPLVPELSGALTLTGKPIRKIAALHVVIDAGDHSASGDFSGQVLDMRAQVAGTRTVAFRGTTYQLPHPGQFRIGLFNFIAVAKNTHWLNPKVLGPAIGNGIFPVLWEPSTGLVWVDIARSRDFRHARLMRDFNTSGDWAYFGSLHSPHYPLLRTAVSFVVLPDAQKQTVTIGLGIGTHGTGVMTSAAGKPVGPNDPVHGVAPAARVSSFEYNSTMHSEAEAVIAAAEDPQTDVVVFETTAEVIPTNEEGVFFSALDERLVKRFDKPIFVPGDNTPAEIATEDEGLGPDVFAVSAYQSARSYQLYDGFTPATNDHKHWGGLTDGPAQDGALKPDLLAPSGYIAAWQAYFWDPFEAQKPGLYTLPAGITRFGGTSQATPTAGGAAALLLSAAKQTHMHLHAVELGQALRLAARQTSQLTASDQGNGVLDIAATWNILTSQSHTAGSHIGHVARVCAASVHTALWPYGTPNGGAGILETLGWHPGSDGTRTMRFCLPNPLPGASASLSLNDGTFRITHLRNESTSAVVSVEIHPKAPGLHTALVTLRDAHGYAVGRGMVAVAAATPLDAGNNYSTTQHIVVPRPGYTTTFVDVPKNTDALLVNADRDTPFAVTIQDPSGALYEHVPFSQTTHHYAITVPSPMAGAWEVLLEDTHDVWDATRELLPVVPESVSITMKAVRVSTGQQSLYANVPVHETGTVQTLAQRTGRFDSRKPVLIPIDIPAGTDDVFVNLSGSDRRVDAYLFDCRTKFCAFFGQVTGGEDDKRMMLPISHPGKYVLALDDYDPARTGSSLPAYRVSASAYTHYENGTRDGRAYEVNCQPQGSEIDAAPVCGLFIAP